MIVGSLTEDRNFEQRIAITPEIIKKYKNLGFDIVLSKGYGNHLGINDKEFSDQGVNILNSSEEVISKSDLILQHNILNQQNLKALKEGQTLIGVLDSYKNEEQLKNLAKNNINFFSLELLPRITRAQSMDILSSQANLAGYKAVVDSFAFFKKAVPMMMTAAGTISAARVLVVGAGVAGLQAIATAKRMGAVVFATDVRAASKEQVESLGGKFLEVKESQNMETSGGYAKEASEDYKKKQAEMMSNALKKNDIVICTALIPGKPAPKILTEELVKLMKPGSIIYDLAAEQGGNSAFSQPGKTNIINGIKIIGVKNLMNRLPLTASNLYAKNLFSFIRNLYSREKKDFNINMEDEIISKSRLMEVI